MTLAALLNWSLWLDISSSPVFLQQAKFYSQATLESNLLRVLKTIANENDSDLLLKKLMKIILENAGAQRGLLLLEKNGQLFIEAESTMDRDEAIVLQSIPLSSQSSSTCYHIPHPNTLIEYVKRSKETIVLDDATQADQFSNDPYITKHQVKSVLCMPLIAQTCLTGILYLENNLIPNVFTAERIQTLEILSAQIVMVIKNTLAGKEMANIEIAYKKKIAKLENELSNNYKDWI
jgi:GAF domain-containing protein